MRFTLLFFLLSLAAGSQAALTVRRHQSRNLPVVMVVHQKDAAALKKREPADGTRFKVIKQKKRRSPPTIFETDGELSEDSLLHYRAPA